MHARITSGTTACDVDDKLTGLPTELMAVLPTPEMPVAGLPTELMATISTPDMPVAGLPTEVMATLLTPDMLVAGSADGGVTKLVISETGLLLLGGVFSGVITGVLTGLPVITYRWKIYGYSVLEIC